MGNHCELQSGFDTFCYYHSLSPKQKRKILDQLQKLPEFRTIKSKTRDRMLYLLRKTSDKDSLTAALEALRKKFDLSKSQCKTILNKFKNLGISPITLRNDSDFEEILSLSQIIGR